MKVAVSEDEELVSSVRQKLKENDGYCPCQIFHTPDTKCMCLDFRTQTPVGQACHCGLYIKTEE